MSESWRVVAQRQSSKLMNGQFQEVMVVTFETADGVTADISVPLAQYSEAHVKQLIDERVKNITEVHSLTSSSAPSPPSTSS